MTTALQNSSLLGGGAWEEMCPPDLLTTRHHVGTHRSPRHGVAAALGDQPDQTFVSAFNQTNERGFLCNASANFHKTPPEQGGLFKD